MADELVQSTRRLSDQAVKNCNADHAFAYRDGARVLELMEIAKARPLTDDEKAEGRRLAKSLEKYRDTGELPGEKNDE